MTLAPEPLRFKRFSILLCDGRKYDDRDHPAVAAFHPAGTRHRSGWREDIMGCATGARSSADRVWHLPVCSAVDGVCVVLGIDGDNAVVRIEGNARSDDVVVRRRFSAVRTTVYPRRFLDAVLTDSRDTSGKADGLCVDRTAADFAGDWSEDGNDIGYCRPHRTDKLERGARWLGAHVGANAQPDRQRGRPYHRTPRDDRHPRRCRARTALDGAATAQLKQRA